ncbi:MAG TPA: formate dehydrogenase subunit delta [Polyangiaceae bacterium]|nr:formate dehydrogenase subunit delta [Polyangiaceae bacterium]
MKAEKLVRMANDIATFFESDPDPAAARAQIAAHLTKFWDPRMRRELVAHVDERAGEGLRASAREAILAHRATLVPAAPGPTPTSGS